MVEVDAVGLADAVDRLAALDDVGDDARGAAGRGGAGDEDDIARVDGGGLKAAGLHDQVDVAVEVDAVLHADAVEGLARLDDMGDHVGGDSAVGGQEDTARSGAGGRAGGGGGDHGRVGVGLGQLDLVADVERQKVIVAPVVELHDRGLALAVVELQLFADADERVVLYDRVGLGLALGLGLETIGQRDAEDVGGVLVGLRKRDLVIDMDVLEIFFLGESRVELDDRSFAELVVQAVVVADILHGLRADRVFHGLLVRKGARDGQRGEHQDGQKQADNSLCHFLFLPRSYS